MYLCSSVRKSLREYSRNKLPDQNVRYVSHFHFPIDCIRTSRQKPRNQFLRTEFHLSAMWAKIHMIYKFLSHTLGPKYQF